MSMDESWRQHAKCKGMNPSMFFELYEQSNAVQLEVDKLCANCPVQNACLDYAIANNLEGGVFGRRFFSQKKVKVKR